MAKCAQTLPQSRTARSLKTASLVICAALVCSATAVEAQEYQPQTYPPTQTKGKEKPADTTPSNLISDHVPTPTVQEVRHFFEPAPEPEYHLYDGDEVKIDVAGHLELSSTQTIGPDGRVTVPLAGSLIVAGMKRDDASAMLSHVLSTYYYRPYVTVTVTHYSSYRLIILGNVQHPGAMQFDRPPTLLEALARAGVGSVSNPGNLVGPEGAAAQNGNATMGLAGIPAWRCLIYRGDSSMAWVDLRGLLSGESFGNMQLQRDDVVLIPVESKFISVLGAVTRPGPQHLMPQISLQEVIATAGGLTQAAGTNPLITVIDPTTKKTYAIRFLDLMTPNGMRKIELSPGDVVFVPNSKISTVGYVLQQLSPIAEVLTFTALATEYF